MTLGALIGACQEDESGELMALYPLAGRTLLEYQVRCAAAAGAAPIVALVEKVPPALQEAIERLRAEGMPVVAVSDGNEAASRFEAGALILQIVDGLAPDFGLITRVAEQAEPVIAVVPDDEEHQQHERIDAVTRWSGVAVVDAHTLGSTAAMLGDWDLQSTMLRRAIQDGAKRLQVGDDVGGTILATSADGLANFERRLLVASRGARSDWASRFALPIVEEVATERLMETRVRPEWLVFAGLVLTLAAAFGFTRGWLWQSYLVLVISTPLDLVADRLAALRLKPMVTGLWTRRLLWPAAGAALMALGWFVGRHDGGWGAILAALCCAAFAEAGRIERAGISIPPDQWLFSRRNAVIGAAPFVAMGAWLPLIITLLAYASISFFVAQHFRHRLLRD